MQFGMFTSGYQRFPLELIFKDAKRFGYDYIELWGARPHAFPYDADITIPDIKRMIDRYEMPVKIYTPEMNAYPFNMMWEHEKMWQDSIDYTCKAMDFAKEIGAEYTLISAGHAGYQVSDEEIARRLKKGLEKLVSHAEKINHKIIYEPLTIYESNVTTSANQMKTVLDTVNHPALKGMVDIIVPYVQAENIISYLDKLGDKMVHMHIIDSDGNSESHVCPGEGVLPLDQLMFELKERNYAGTITIELVTNYLTEPSFYAKRALDNLKGLL